MNRNVGTKFFVHFGDATAGFTHLFVMAITTLDRFAKIKLNLKYRLYCNTKKEDYNTVSCFYYLMSFLRWFVNKLL